jgi:outer membrane protein OmpA-like peptidoglycan-associated protein
MKQRIAKAIIYSVLLTVSAPAICQHYYVIIGAFAIESNAKKLTGYARSKYFDAQYSINKKNKLFHVYILSTSSKHEAIMRTLEMQKETEFKDAWLYHGFLGDDHLLVEKKPLVDIKPVIMPDSIIVEAVTINPIKAVESAPLLPADSAALATTPPLNPKGKIFKFIITTDEGKPLSGQVHAVDRRRGRDLASFTSNHYVDVTPKGGSNLMTVVCGIFGYKETEKIIDYSDPKHIDGAQQDSLGAWVVPFKLERLAKGDVSVMYNVSFYKDAVVMLPASKKELDELVNLMNLYQDYKITVHGHCNGRNDRKIIALGTTKNYFHIEGSNEINGTAKQLSEFRAEAVQSYLIDQGIDASRIKIYGWAAEGMLVDQNSTSAKLNDRIEIEIH